MDLARVSKECEPQWLLDTLLAPSLVVSHIAVPMVRLLAGRNRFSEPGSWRGFHGFPPLEPYRPSSTPVQIDCRSRGWMPSRFWHLDGTGRLLMHGCWRVCESFPSRTMSWSSPAKSCLWSHDRACPEENDLREVTLTRRIPVREHRAKGWRA